MFKPLKKLPRLPFILYLSFVIANLLDLFTSYYIIVGEANILYVLTKNFATIVLAKILLFALVYYYLSGYHLFNDKWKLITNTVMLITIIANIISTIINIGGIYQQGSVVVEDYAATSLLGVYFMYVSIVFVLPTILALVLIHFYFKNKVKKVG
jgi:hypothetical protein